MKIAGAVALVTGSNRGIGAAIVEALAAAGARKIYAASRAPTSLTPTTATTANGEATIIPVALDITDDARVTALARDLADVDILVNNAGISLGQTFLRPGDTASAHEEMRVNYFGTLGVVRAFAPVLRKNGGGAIVNVLSITSHITLPTAGSYSASKAAALALTSGIRAELAAQNTLVIGVMPGFVDTDMTARIEAPKMPPAVVATDLVNAILSGTEDVYPGEAATLVALHHQDPKVVERQFAAFLRPATS